MVLDLSDAFLSELPGEDVTGPLRGVNLHVKRPGDPEKFVTKVSVSWADKKQKLGVAEILEKWQQMPVKKGDLVFF